LLSYLLTVAIAAEAMTVLLAARVANSWDRGKGAGNWIRNCCALDRTAVLQRVLGHMQARRLLVSALCVGLGVAQVWAQAPQPTPARSIDLDQAIQLALSNSPTLRAARNNILQNQDQEITANLRPNPVLGWDALFVPVFSPGSFSRNFLNNTQEFDVGLGYLFERGRKRQARLAAAQDTTQVTRAQVADQERSITLQVAQQFVNVLQAVATLRLAQQDLASFQQTVNIGEEQYRAGAISEGDLLKIKLQTLQFQTDVSAAQLALAQARASLRQVIGYNALAPDYAVSGELGYTPVHAGLDQLKAIALSNRPDLRAARLGITAAQSQYRLAKANGKQDLNTTLQYTHTAGTSEAGFIFNIPLPLFNRNQGEIARTSAAITQAQDQTTAAEEVVITDVQNAYEAVQTSDQIVRLYQSGYLKQSQDSRDIAQYAYRRGAASLLDFLDAERSYRATQLGYLQSLATYMTAVEQLKVSVGSRTIP
jgi:cobalt-zinc-cadmium efflux system outer membrane protein